MSSFASLTNKQPQRPKTSELEENKFKMAERLKKKSLINKEKKVVSKHKFSILNSPNVQRDNNNM